MPVDVFLGRKLGVPGPWSEQFGFVLHFDETRPLEPSASWEAGEVAETFPSRL